LYNTLRKKSSDISAMKLTYLCRGVLLIVLLTACNAATPVPDLTPSLTPTPEIPTPTKVWFPPTNTPTLFPTRTLPSASDQRPGLGDLFFADKFDQPELWNTSTAASGSATVSRNQLVLSISGQGPLTIASLRSQPTLGDFYAEAMVTLSLCGSSDQFGILFRAAPGEINYRFVVTCNGQTRVERSQSGSHLPLNTWLSSGDAPMAAPAEIKLGVWAAGSEMRFFLNDHFQFTVVDRILHTGTLGFFVYASGAAPITALFSNLSVYSVAYVSPVPTLTPSRTPTSTRTPVPSRTPTP
jgi:hypothetical protein